MPKKPIILIFIDWYLPGYKAGGPIRSIANLVDHLGDEVEFLIVTRNTDYMSDEPYPDISPDQWTDYAKNARVHYISKNNLSIKNLKEIVRKTPHDHIYINGFFSFYFSILPVWLGKKISRKPVILAPRGMLGSGAISVKPFRKRIFLILARLLKIYRPVFFHATNPQEVTYIQNRIDTKAKIVVAPNLPRKDIPLSLLTKAKMPGTLNLVSIARIAPEKNTLYSLKTLKENFTGDLHLDLFGSIYDQTYWTRCEEEILDLPENVTVNYRESIPPEQIPGLLTNYHFLFLPTTGENFGHIILEAMTAGLPVIISNRTPWKNLEATKAGWDISLDQPSVFRKTIQRCLNMYQGKYNEFSNGAFRYAEKYINDPGTVEASRKLFVNSY